MKKLVKILAALAVACVGLAFTSCAEVPYTAPAAPAATVKTYNFTKVSITSGVAGSTAQESTTPPTGAPASIKKNKAGDRYQSTASNNLWWSKDEYSNYLELTITDSGDKITVSYSDDVDDDGKEDAVVLTYTKA